MNSISSTNPIADENVKFTSYVSNSITNSNGEECDVTCELLVARLLSQLSKEHNSAEMKEQEEKRAEDEKREAQERLRAEEEKFIKEAHRAYDEKLSEGKVKMVSELLSQLRMDDKEEICRTFLSMSTSPECCSAMRQSKCLPVVVGLLHSSWHNDMLRTQASKTLSNIVQHCADTKQGRKEAFVFKLVEQMLKYCELRETEDGTQCLENPPNPTQTVALLMKLSFNEEYRVAMCEFGALHALAKVFETEHVMNNGELENLSSETLTIRRFAGMALTNLTFRDCTNKATLCSFDSFMRVLVAQLQSPYEDLCQVTASVLRNLSWRADNYIKTTLRNVDAVTALMKAALRLEKETTLKAVLSALWNLSAHNNQNKIDICNVDGSIEYLVKMLNYQAPSGSFTIVENVGGILRNISSLIAVREDYRIIIREYNCLYVLLHQLTSPSLTIVSNACGTLWNLSARCTEDQIALINLGALNMLRSLIHSKHKMISVACSAALKNLQNVRDAEALEGAHAGSLALRKRRALQDEIDNRLRESGDVVERDDQQVNHENNVTESDTATTTTTPETKSNNDSTIARSLNSVRFSLPSSHDCKSDKTTLLPSKSSMVGNVTKGILVKLNGATTTTTATTTTDDESKATNGYRKVEEPYNVDDTFNDYAETDLDQPTNYSLRFAEMGRIDAEQSEIMITEKDAENDRVNKITDLLGNVCLETPLMYSRSSSLGSVSVDSAPPDEDVGSVVSEFSHAVSGVISPSEIPASPSETVPTSPRPSSKRDRSSIFEDTVTVFKDEATPIQFSMASSLSSLTFDDPEPHATLKPVMERCEKLNAAAADNDSNSRDEEKERGRRGVFCLELELSPEEEQAMLNDCIDNGRPGEDKTTTTTTTTPLHHQQPLGDVTLHFCTEDTPVSISHAASNSDLSLLCPSEDSFLQNSLLPLSSSRDATATADDGDDDDTDIIELPDDEQEKLLNMCIASGQSMNYNSNDDCRTSQSSTLSEITEDLPIEERTLIEDMTESGNLVTATFSTTAASGTAYENDYSFIQDDSDGKELSEEQCENLLNQCIAMGMRNMKEAKETSDLENIGPPSFLAEANLDGSLINVEEITDYPPGKITPKQKRHQMKDRYSTYTVKLSPTKNAPKNMAEPTKKLSLSKERRAVEKDRFKTRTLSKIDFDEIAKNQEYNNVFNKSAKLSASNGSIIGADEIGSISDCESYLDSSIKGKLSRPIVNRVKSGIPVVKSKLPTTKNTVSGKNSAISDLPVNLQRQNTFTKEEQPSSAIPVRKNSFKNAATSGGAKTTINENGVQFKSGIPSRIKEPSPKVSRATANTRSPDISKNRWSVSENDLNANNAPLKASSTSLNASPYAVAAAAAAAAAKISPAASHSALPVRRESAIRTPNNYSTYKK